MKQIKHRWIAFENLGEPISTKELISAIRRESLRLYGILRAGDLKFLLVEFNEEKQFGIIRVSLKGLRMLRTIFFFLREINGKKVLFNDLLVSGTIRSLRKKLKEKRLSMGLMGPAGLEPATDGSGDRRSFR